MGLEMQLEMPVRSSKKRRVEGLERENSSKPERVQLIEDLKIHWNNNALTELKFSHKPFGAISQENIRLCLRTNKVSRDPKGNTPLMTSVTTLLNNGHYEEAVNVAKSFLKAGVDVNASNSEGNTVLHQSILYMDKSLPLTRYLVNQGANVWPTSQHHSAFSVFLQRVISERKLKRDMYLTLALLCDVMCADRKRMQALVINALFRYGSCIRVMGPVYVELKESIIHYWREPLPLMALCRNSLRKNINEHWLDTVPLSRLPISLKRYLALE